VTALASEQTILCLNVGSSSCKFSLYESSDKLIAAGANYRVVELFKLTHVDSLIPMAATAEEAESL